MGFLCRFPRWPMWPMIGTRVLLALLAIAGGIFSLVMLIDCLKRPASQFAYPLTRNGQYDRLIWAVAILVSFWFYFIGAIVYFFVVKTARPQDSV